MKNKKGFKIVFVGAGNLATHLAVTLYRYGFAITQVYSRTSTAAAHLAQQIEADHTANLQEIVTDASLYIVSLTDAAFIELLPDIVEGKRKDALFVHTAGTIPMDVWHGFADRYGVFYPMQTFSKQRQVDFTQIPIFVEANTKEDTALLFNMASEISRKVYEATSEQRKKLHVAAVFACNFTNHLYALTAELLQKSDLPFDVMLPLIDETSRKIHTLTPHDAQTGPAKRNDELVMEEHLRMLSDTPEIAKIYAMLSESIANHHKTKE